MITITICDTVFDLPHIDAAITTFSDAATRRTADIINSLAIIIITAIAGSLSISIRQIIAVHTSNLSARGSISLPKLVIRLYFLAILPSNKSVRLATTKIINAIIVP